MNKTDEKKRAEFYLRVSKILREASIKMGLRSALGYHYCDSVGFQELPAFQRSENHLKAAEMSMDDDYGMIDGIINNGKAADYDRREKKPSVLEQLRNQPVQERTHKTAPQKSAERKI